MWNNLKEFDCHNSIILEKYFIVQSRIKLLVYDMSSSKKLIIDINENSTNLSPVRNSGFLLLSPNRKEIVVYRIGQDFVIKDIHIKFDNEIVNIVENASKGKKAKSGYISNSKILVVFSDSLKLIEMDTDYRYNIHSINLEGSFSHSIPLRTPFNNMFVVIKNNNGMAFIRIMDNEELIIEIHEQPIIHQSPIIKIVSFFDLSILSIDDSGKAILWESYPDWWTIPHFYNMY